MADSTSLSNYSVLDEGYNLSDHFPIMMSLKTKLQPRPLEASRPVNVRQLKWAKLSESHKDIAGEWDSGITKQIPFQPIRTLHALA